MTDGADTGRSWLPLLGVVLATVGALWLLAGLAVLPGGRGWAYDYTAYADAAQRLEQTGSLYQAETLAGPYRPGPSGLYMYAPPFGVAVAALGGLDVETAAVAWYLLHGSLLAAACALLPVPAWIRLAAFGIAALSLAVTKDFSLGNVSSMLLLPLAAAWRWLDRPAGSVAQAIAISVRPMLGVLLIWQLFRRQWRAVAWTVGAGIVLVLLTLPFVGIQGYGDYLSVLRNLEGATGVAENHDLSSTLLRLGLSESVATLGLLVGYVLAIAAVGLSLRRDRELGYVVTAAASLLLSPLMWDHYLAMLLLPAAFLAARGHRWGLLLPLASWLPSDLYPFVALAAVWLPFMARGPIEPQAAPAPLRTSAASA